jgi:cellulose synthase (UDP-forming)
MTSTTLEHLPAFLGNTRSQLKKRTLLFRYAAIINLMLGAWYLDWRVTQSVNWHVWWISVPLLLAEVYSYVGGALFIIGLWRPLVRQVRSLHHLMPNMPPDNWPTVDVFITCCNEPADIVEKTARAALAINYPANKLRVYILDDGNTPTTRAMAEQLCLEDLQSAELRGLSDKYWNERERLMQQQSELIALLPEVQQLALENKGRDSGLIQRVVALLNSTQQPLVDRVSSTIQQLEKSIHEQALTLSELPRCRYIARDKPVTRSHHAKAGNINYAIFSGQTAGEFILTLDADHVPNPQFLQRVLPYFFDYNLRKGRYEDNAIAFVQTPQCFSNLPNNDPFGHQAQLFYGPIQQGKDGLNAAFYTGTNAVLRRDALVTTGLQSFSEVFEQDSDRLYEFDLIGGLSSHSITEDMNTAMRLHAAGWRSAYHNEVLAVGLAPDDLVSTLKQRLRWAQGTLQVLQAENPLTKPGLSFWQRLQYFQTMYSYFSGFATLIFLACPLFYFFAGIIAIEADGMDFLLHFLPVYLINRLTFLIVAWGISAAEIWRSEQYAVALFPLFIKSVWSVFLKHPLTFQVTPKQRRSGVYLRLVWPQLVLFGLLIVGMLWDAGQLALGQLATPVIYWVNVCWSLYSLSLLWAVIRASFWSPPTSA